TNGLDPVGIREMRTLVRSLGEEGFTVLVSSHLLSEVSQVATHVGVLVGAHLRYEGTLAALLAVEQGHLAVETSDQAASCTLLAKHYPGVRQEGNRLLVPVAESEAAGAIAALYQAGIPVLRIAYEHADLESQFMRLIEPQTTAFIVATQAEAIR
ncbi:MAG: ATP-binding cassette domain-containing protein, partial [Chloroflexota bacterium]